MCGHVRAPDDASQVALAHVDGVGDGEKVDNARAPEVLVALLRGQAVIEGGQPRALKGRARQDVVAQDQARRRRKAAQRVACTC